MILVDTSVWIAHLRHANDGLPGLFDDSAILAHEFVIGELALGSIKARETVIAALRELPQAPIATPQEVRALIETHTLHGTGIGYVDAHLLASARLADAKILSSDKRLMAHARRLGVAAPMA